jgi:hypothetical protein
MTRKIQTTNQVVDVSIWPPDDDYSPYPEGARPKTAYICPDDATLPFLIPKHRYLFKQSNPRYPEQYWAEIVAYIAGGYTNVAVPPAFVSCDSRSHKCGALVEWFYGYPEEKCVSRYTMGGDYMTRMIPRYDRVKGTQHNFRSIETLSRALTKADMLRDNFVSYWSKIFIFDALIGNTDRHQDNWGLIWYNSIGVDSSNIENLVAMFSPAFDNGTAMGHEILGKNFCKFEDPAYLKRYVARGTYHIKWTQKDEKRLGFREFLLKFSSKYPESKKEMFETLRFDIERLVDDIMELTAFKVYLPLSKARAIFMTNLLRYRHQQLLELVSD